MVVEQRAGAVGDRFLGELVQTLVGDLDRVLDLEVVAGRPGRIGVGDLDGQPGTFEAIVADERAVLGQRGVDRRGSAVPASRWTRSTISISIAGRRLSSSSMYHWRYAAGSMPASRT